jgi:hypothetical protein
MLPPGRGGRGATYNPAMTSATLSALSPLDGRYAAKLAPCAR